MTTLWFIVGLASALTISALAAAVFVLRRVRKPSTGSLSALHFLRFEGEEGEANARSIANRQQSIRSADDVREAALELARAAPTATHAFIGEARDAPEGPRLARCGLDGGVVLGFTVRSRRAQVIAPDAGLAEVLRSLREIATWTSSDFAADELSIAKTSPDALAPSLIAVRDEARPGHRLCGHCHHAFAAHDPRCPNCGARVTGEPRLAEVEIRAREDLVDL